MLSLFLGLALTGVPEAPKLKIDSDGALRHPSSVRAIAIMPDSRTAFVALNDGALLAYSIETRKAVQVGTRAYSMLFDLALNNRGDRLAVVDAVSNVTLYDTATLKSITSVRLKFDAEHVVFHPNGAWLYVALANGHLMKLNATDLSTVRDIFPTAGSRVLALACSPDGDTVATSDREGQIKLWSDETGELKKSWKGHAVLARSLAFSPSGKHLISGGEEADFKVWNLADYSLLKESKEYHQQAIQCITFTPDDRIVTCGFDGLCQFWDAKTFKGGKSYPNYRGYITACAASADGRWLVRGGSSLDFVPLAHPDKFERLADYGGAILGFAVAGDMKRVVSGGLDRRLIHWKVDKGIISKSILLEDWLTAVEFCQDDDSVAVGLANGKIQVHAADTLEREKSWQAHKGRITGIAIVEKRIASIGDDGAVHLWNIDGGSRWKTFDEKAPCRSIAVRGKRLAVGTANGTVSIYDGETGTLVKRLKGRPLSVTALAFSGRGTRLMVGYFDGGLESFDVESWSVAQYRPGDGDSVLSIDVNLKSGWVAVGFRDGRARILDVVTLQEGAAVQTRLAREIFSIRWALNSNTFAAAGASNEIAFYRITPLKGAGSAAQGMLNVRGRLVRGSDRDRVRANSFAKVFTTRLEKGRTYVIDLTSTEIDPYLRLEDAAGNQLAEDDDGGVGLNARLVFTPRQTGIFRIIATTFQNDATGAFHLEVTPR